MGWQSEQMTSLPPWATGEGSIALLNQVRDESPAEVPVLDEHENSCWWVLSVLDRFDAKEAREKYYARL